MRRVWELLGFEQEETPCSSRVVDQSAEENLDGRARAVTKPVRHCNVETSCERERMGGLVGSAGVGALPECGCMCMLGFVSVIACVCMCVCACVWRRIQGAVTVAGRSTIVQDAPRQSYHQVS